MSLARIIAMMAARPSISFVGFTSHDHGSATLPLHANALPGDYALIEYLNGRTFSGGSVTPWNEIVLGGMKVSHRLLEAGDISGSMVFDNPTNMIAAVIRGPYLLGGSPVTSAAFTGPGTNNMAGFTKSANAVAYVCFATGDLGPPGLQTNGGRFSNSSTQSSTLPTGFGVTMGVQIQPGDYPNGTNFPITDSLGAEVDAAIYELF